MHQRVSSRLAGSKRRYRITSCLKSSIPSCKAPKHSHNTTTSTGSPTYLPILQWQYTMLQLIIYLSSDDALLYKRNTGVSENWNSTKFTSMHIQVVLWGLDLVSSLWSKQIWKLVHLSPLGTRLLGNSLSALDHTFKLGDEGLGLNCPRPWQWHDHLQEGIIHWRLTVRESRGGWVALLLHLYMGMDCHGNRP